MLTLGSALGTGSLALGCLLALSALGTRRLSLNRLSSQSRLILTLRAARLSPLALGTASLSLGAASLPRSLSHGLRILGTIDRRDLFLGRLSRSRPASPDCRSRLRGRSGRRSSLCPRCRLGLECRLLRRGLGLWRRLPLGCRL